MTAFGSPEVPRRERDQARVPGVELAAGGASRVEPLAPGTRQIVGPSGPAASSTSALRSSATTSAGRATSRRSRRSFARSCSVHGRTTAPRRKQATIVITHSGRLPSSVSTTSPRRTPCSSMCAATVSAHADTSPNSTRAGGRRARARRSRAARAAWLPRRRGRSSSARHPVTSQRFHSPGTPRRVRRPRSSKRTPNPRTEVVHGARGHHAAGARLAHHARRDVDCEASDVVADHLDLAGVQAGRGRRGRAS